MKVRINDNFFVNFNDFSVSTQLDSVASTFAFAMPKTEKDKNKIEICRPLSYYKCDLFNDAGKVFLTGNITNHDFNSKATPELIVVSGYSKGGILEDVTIPYSQYPLESIGLNLKDIASKLCKLYGVGLVIDGSVRQECEIAYEKSVAEPTDTIKDYLCKLAAQRNIIVGHDIHGRIILFRPNIHAKSKEFFNKENTTEMSLSVDGRALHSEIAIIRQASKDNPDLTGADILKNSMVKQYRSTVKTLSSGEETDTDKAVKNLIADELKAIKLSLSFNSWKSLYVGDIIEVQNEEIFIHKRSRFIVQTTNISESPEGRTMTVEAMLPEAFSGDMPKDIFKK